MLAPPPPSSSALFSCFPAALGAAAVAQYSAESLRCALSAPAELLVAPLEGDRACFLGQFERNTASPKFGGGVSLPTFRRGSGGGPILVGPGLIYVNLRLATPSALTPCDAAKLLNRYVRPLLRALTKVAAPSHYFGRDWISCGGAPIASIGFAHHAASQRAMVESVIAFSAPFVAPGALSPSFLGKQPSTVLQVSAKDRNVSEFCRLVGQSYAEAYGRELSPGLSPPRSEAQALGTERAWDATLPEAIGDIGASVEASHLRLGGAFMASEDAVREFEGRVSALGPTATRDDIGADADAVFASAGAAQDVRVALFGVRSLASIRDVAFAALENARRS